MVVSAAKEIGSIINKRNHFYMPGKLVSTVKVLSNENTCIHCAPGNKTSIKST